MTIEFINSKHLLYSEVKKLGRKYSATLGYMPEGGFDDYAKRKCIIIVRDGEKLFGYLMYRITVRYSRVSIVHLAVDDLYRGKGVSTMLLDALRDKYRNSGLSGIVLNCRRDFIMPSKLWEKYGFIAKGQKRSRSYETNFLTTWWYSFDQRDLFSQEYEESDKVRALMDSNIIMTLRDSELGQLSQLNPKEDPRCLLADWLVDETDLCFSQEVYNEINRDNNTERSNSTRSFLTNFTQAHYNIEEQKLIVSRLREFLKGNTDNDESDRKQIASCIAAGIPYFLTNDTAILGRRSRIEELYEIQIYTPQEFLIKIDQLLHNEKYAPALLRGVTQHTLSRLDAGKLQNCLSQFLNKGFKEHKKDFENVVNGCVNSEGCLFAVSFQDSFVSFYGVSKDSDNKIVHFIRISNGSLSIPLFYKIITDIQRDCLDDNTKMISVLERYLTEEQKSFLLNFGFLEQPDKSFVKYIRNEIIFLTDVPQLLKEVGYTQNQLPSNVSSLVRLEKMFYPLKIRDLEIPCYIIPIKAYWAGQLFDSVISGDQLFGADPSRLWNFENVYYRHVKPINEHAPARLLWYVSYSRNEKEHSQSIVASSYLIDVQTGKPKEMYRKFKHFGIYEWSDVFDLSGKNLETNVRALKFSHTELFNTPIKLAKINEILLNNGFKKNTFASPLKVSDAIYFEIYKIGIDR